MKKELINVRERRAFPIVHYTMAERIYNDVQSVYKVDMKRTDKRADVNSARAAFCYLCKTLTRLSLAEIGAFIGKDHSTVLHHWRKINEDVLPPDDRLVTVAENYGMIMYNNSKRLIKLD